MYLKYYGAKKVALVYPGSETRNQSGLYYAQSCNNINELSDEECSVISISVDNKVKNWQKEISFHLYNWAESKESANNDDEEY
ncbi:MAG: hypothetical protein WD431_19360 [Cyclobacteriaceae bacterium]